MSNRRKSAVNGSELSHIIGKFLLVFCGTSEAKSRQSLVLLENSK